MGLSAIQQNQTSSGDNVDSLLVFKQDAFDQKNDQPAQNDENDDDPASPAALCTATLDVLYHVVRSSPAAAGSSPGAASPRSCESAGESRGC